MHTAQKKIANYSGFERKKFPFIYLFIAFPVVQFLVFWLYVNFSSIVLAFQDGNGIPTLENFEFIFDAMFKKQAYNANIPLFETMMRSLFLWALDFIILFPIGVTTTYILYREIPGHYIFRLCYIIPSLMGAVIWSMLIIYMVENGGMIMKLLEKWEVPMSEMLQKGGLFGTEETAFPTIVTIKIVMGLVGNNAVLTGAFTRVPDEIYESAELDGAGFWRTYVNIAVPCVWSTIATLMTFSLCSFITADYNVFLFTAGEGDYGTSTVGFLLYKITLQIAEDPSGSPYYGYPAALGVFFTAITLPIVLVGRRIIDKIFVDVEI